MAAKTDFPDRGARRDTTSPGPWRETQLKWTEEEYKKMRQAISSRTPLLDETETYRIVLCGAVGAGKSSFINTIFSAIRGKTGQLALNAVDEKSVTKKFRVYRFRESIKERAIPVTICDTMGFERSTASGPAPRDIVNILDGYIKEGYEFTPNESINFRSPFYNPAPDPNDKVHVLVLVVDASTVQELGKPVIEKLQEITKQANEREIRWMLVLTKIDGVSGGINKDVTSVYGDEDMERIVNIASENFGIDPARIFPVQNYVTAILPSRNVNILALHTLEHILDLADNTLETQKGILSQDETAPKLDLQPSAWRPEDNLTEKAVHTMWAELASTQPTRVPKHRICLMGPSGGGKSAFINSAMSEMYQSILSFADTDCVSQPTTTTYSEYILKAGTDGDELDITLCDTMGVLPGRGLNKKDIPTILDGMASCDTALNSVAPLPRSSSPVPLSNRPHVLALVLNGAEIDSYSPEVIEELQLVLSTARDPSRKLFRLVIVTHVDEVCGHVAADPTKVFRSQEVKKCLEKVKTKLGVPLPDIWPVVNFADDTKVDWRKSALILLALQELVKRAHEFAARSSTKAPAQKKGWFW